MLISLTLAAALVVSGCGGGGGGTVPVADDSTSSLQGTVYTSGVVAAEAGQAPGAQLLFYATVTVNRMSDNAYVADTMTDRNGHYSFNSLPRNLEVLLTVSALSGERLLGRAMLNARECTADIDEDTTLVTMCELLMRRNGGGAVAGDADLAAAVRRLCMRYEQAHRYAYGDLGGVRPDFTSMSAIERAAAALLAAATDDAVNAARASGALGQCQDVVALVCARLRAEGRMQFAWDQETCARVAQAMRDRECFSAEEMVQAALQVRSSAVGPSGVSQLRSGLGWACVVGRTGELDAIEAVAGMCATSDNQIRLTARQQVAAFVQALIG